MFLGVSMSRASRIFLDVDDVLVDFTRKACELHGVCLDTQVAPIRGGLWNLVPAISKLKEEPFTEREFWKPINDAGPDFWALLPKLPHFDELLSLVESYGADWYLLSSPSDCPSSYLGKSRWAVREFGSSFDRLVLTRHKRLNALPGSVLIDDSVHNCSYFWSAEGTNAILFPTIGLAPPSIAQDPVPYVKFELEKLCT